MVSAYWGLWLEIILLSMVGQALGIAGLRLAKRRKRVISPLSTLGTALNASLLSPLYLVLFMFLVVILLPLGLLIWGLALIVVASGKPAKNERELTRAQAQAQVALAAGRRVSPESDPIRPTGSKRGKAS